MSDLSQFQQFLCAVGDTCDLSQCRKILESGLDVNARTSVGCTALMIAVMPNEYGDHNSPYAILNVVKLLLAHGADITIVDSYRMTAVDYAQQLLDPNWTDVFGHSAIDQWNDDTDKSAIAEIIALLEH